MHERQGCEPRANRMPHGASPAGFRPDMIMPCYGMAETTLIVTGGPKGQPQVSWFSASGLNDRQVKPLAADDDDVRALVACGEVLPGERLEIVDEAGAADAERHRPPVPAGGGGEYRCGQPEAGRDRRRACGELPDRCTHAYPPRRTCLPRA